MRKPESGQAVVEYLLVALSFFVVVLGIVRMMGRSPSWEDSLSDQLQSRVTERLKNVRKQLNRPVP